jgi:hypothetical protein
MRTRLRVPLLLLVCAVASPTASRAMPSPPQMAPACYSITSSPCPDCPGYRSKFCLGDPSGLFASCTETIASCDGTHNCSQVTTSTGPACGN